MKDLNEMTMAETNYAIDRLIEFMDDAVGEIEDMIKWPGMPQSTIEALDRARALLQYNRSTIECCLVAMSDAVEDVQDSRIDVTDGTPTDKALCYFAETLAVTATIARWNLGIEKQDRSWLFLS